VIDDFTTLLWFLETESDNVGPGEIVAVGNTGMCALLDADGDVRLVPEKIVEGVGVYLPLWLTLLCPSSYKMGHQSGLSFGGSGSFV